MSRSASWPSKILGAVTLLSGGLCWVAACSSEDDIAGLPPEEALSNRDAGGGGDGGPIFDRCLFEKEGCPCVDEGAVVDCKVYYYVNQGTPQEYTACSFGKHHCEEGIWTECIGERTVIVPPGEVPTNVIIGSAPPPMAGDAGP